MDPFAGDCRSQPWDRNLVVGDADGTSGGRGGCRRLADRGASTADQGTFRRTAATEAGELLGIDAGAEAGGRGGRTRALSSAAAVRTGPIISAPPSGPTRSAAPASRNSSISAAIH